MSKSVGNVVVPTDLLEQHGADAVRYWSANGRPGTDTAFDPGQMKIGRRLAIKLLNASKFALGAGDAAADAPVTEPIDLAMLAELASLVEDCTTAFEAFDYARSLQRTEDFFWRFCDDYLELVKNRAYGNGSGAGSAAATLSIAMSTVHRLFAPFVPFVAEEVWSWWQEGSVHRAPWPDAGELRRLAGAADPGVLDVAAEILSEVHKAKTSQQRSLRTEVERVTVQDVPDRLEALRVALGDVREAGRVNELVLDEADDRRVEVELAADPA
jgi:valyl-tRNA synthetase